MTDRAKWDRKYDGSVKGKVRHKRYNRTTGGRLRSVADIENRRAQRRGETGYVSTAQWKKIVDAAGGVCHYCGEKMHGTLSMDHVIPLSRGGTHTPENIVPACLKCNREKSDKRCQGKSEIAQGRDRARF